MNSSDSTSNSAYLRYDTERTDSLPIKPVVEVQLRECPQGILWCNGGRWAVIPAERVTNAVLLRNEKRGAGMSPTPLVFYWHEATVLSVSELASLGLLTSTGQIRRLRSTGP